MLGQEKSRGGRKEQQAGGKSRGPEHRGSLDVRVVRVCVMLYPKHSPYGFLIGCDFF